MRVHVGQVQAPAAAVVPVGDGDAHRVARIAGGGVVRHRAEGAIALVVPQIVGAVVVPLEQVEVAVAVEVEQVHRVGIARAGNAPGVRLLAEPQAALIDEQQRVGAVPRVHPVEPLRIARLVGLVAGNPRDRSTRRHSRRQPSAAARRSAGRLTDCRTRAHSAGIANPHPAAYADRPSRARRSTAPGCPRAPRGRRRRGRQAASARE